MSKQPAPSAIILSAEVHRQYQATVGRLPPETFAMLGGTFDDPYRVTAFRFMPPRFDDGRLDASSAHINVDANALNYIIDHEWRPSGIELLGFLHSHPNGSAQPSTGDYDSNEGDVAFFSACLANDDSPGRRWNTCLCPIVTFADDASAGAPQIHGWALPRRASKPIRTSIIVEDETMRTTDSTVPTPEAMLARSKRQVSLARELLSHYAREIAALRRDHTLSDEERTPTIAGLEALRDHALRELRHHRHAISLSLGLATDELPADIASPIERIAAAANLPLGMLDNHDRRPGHPLTPPCRRGPA